MSREASTGLCRSNLEDPIGYCYIMYGIPVLYTAVLLFIALINYKIADYGVGTDFYNFVPVAKEYSSGNFKIQQFRGPGYF